MRGLLSLLAVAFVALQLLLCASDGIGDEITAVATGSLCWLVDDCNGLCEKYVRGWMLLWFGVAERSAWSIDQLDMLLGMRFQSDRFMPPLETGNCSLLVGPAVSAVAMLRALRSDGSPAAAARAYLVFRAVDAGGLGALVGHLEQDWPVFALLDVLVERLGRGVAGASSAGVALASVATVGDGSVGPHDDLQPCAAGAWAECVLACVAAARRLPSPQSLRHLGRQRHGPAADAAAGVRRALLQQAAVAINRLGPRGLVELGRRGVWLALHQLHVELRLRVACPEGSVLYRTEEVEPAYDVCIPRRREWGVFTITDHRNLGAAEAIPDDQHYTYTVLEQGRWRDCDELGPLAESVGLQPLTDGALAVDVGSNLGSCSCYLLALGFKVHAIDTDTNSHRYLRGAAWREILEGRLLVHQAMVGTGPGRLSLDELLEHERSPMLVKIDIEGGELEALRGARRALSSGRVRAVLLELHCNMLEAQGEDPFEALEVMLQAGFDVFVKTLNCWMRPIPEQQDVLSKEMAVKSRRDLDMKRRKLLPLEGPNLQVVARLPPSLVVA